MCDLLEGVCTFWGGMMDASGVRSADPTITWCISSPRQGEEGWLAYAEPRLDPARVSQLDIERCQALASEARIRGHWEMAKLVAFLVGTAVMTAVVYVGTCAVVALVTVATGVIFAQLAAIALTAGAVGEFLAGVTIFVALFTIAVELLNGIPATICVFVCTWTKEGLPLISRSYGYMQHLYERSRELEILGARDPEPAALEGA